MTHDYYYYSFTYYISILLLRVPRPSRRPEGPVSRPSSESPHLVCKYIYIYIYVYIYIYIYMYTHTNAFVYSSR